MAKLTPEKRKKMEDTIYGYFNKIDKTKTNTKKYKEFFSGMSDAQFEKYFKEFFENDKAYLVLDIADYENTLTIEDIEDAADFLKIPLFEHVYMPHLTMDKENIVVTPEKVPVGYIEIKRTQQTVMKKNGMSTRIDQRSAITNQVTGKDKNGRESDLENTMLLTNDLIYTLREMNGPRADDSHMKNQMLQSIAMNGYVSLDELESDVYNKTTLNTVDTFILGMSLKSDLVTSGLLLKKEIEDELK